jgi:hypothetical protein
MMSILCDHSTSVVRYRRRTLFTRLWCASRRAPSTDLSTFGCVSVKAPTSGDWLTNHRHECRCSTPGGVRHITVRISDGPLEEPPATNLCFGGRSTAFGFLLLGDQLLYQVFEGLTMESGGHYFEILVEHVGARESLEINVVPGRDIAAAWYDPEPRMEIVEGVP